jgi:hypothetical protein
MSFQLSTEIQENKYNFNTDLPLNFKISNLDDSHYQQIYNLIEENYTENRQCQFIKIYSIDYIKWLLKWKTLFIGICYRENLLGCIGAMNYTIEIDSKEYKIAHIILLCVRQRVRKIGLAKILIKEIKKQLNSYQIAIWFDPQNNNNNNNNNKKNESKTNISLNTYSILINLPLLKSLKICPPDCVEINRVEHNPLEYTLESDLKDITVKINQYTKRFKVRHLFTEETAKQFLISKKRICYSFVKRSANYECTDFICVYISYQKFTKKGKLMKIANLGYYYINTVDVNELINLLIDKLIECDVDQLNYTDNGINQQIDLIRYRSDTVYQFNNIGLDMSGLNKEQLFVHHF